jgi:CO dehydrogenase/acetyl-CoA synthase alpha subunit
MTIDDLNREIGELYCALASIRSEHNKVNEQLRADITDLQSKARNSQRQLNIEYESKAERFALLTEMMEEYDGTQDILQLKLKKSEARNVPDIEVGVYVPSSIKDITTSAKINASTMYGAISTIKGK